MLLVEGIVPGRRVQVKEKSLFRRVYYPHGGESGTVVRLGLKLWEGNVLVRFDSGVEDWVGHDTLKLL